MWDMTRESMMLIFKIRYFRMFMKLLSIQDAYDLHAGIGNFYLSACAASQPHFSIIWRWIIDIHNKLDVF